MVFALLAAHWWTERGADHPAATRTVFWLSGVALFWIAADWPLGPLGAGYLLSIHTVQYILFALVVPPFLISGTAPAVLRRALTLPVIGPACRLLSRPLVAFAVFNVVMLATHLPPVVDRLTVTQLGTFTVDILWLFSGIVFWWQILAPLPELAPLPIPGRIVFVILNVFIPTVPAAFLTFADYPIYALYELAPPIGAITPRADQQVAGLIMKTVGGLIMFGTATVLFFRWYQEDGKTDRREDWT